MTNKDKAKVATLHSRDVYFPHLSSMSNFMLIQDLYNFRGHSINNLGDIGFPIMHRY